MAISETAHNTDLGTSPSMQQLTWLNGENPQLGRRPPPHGDEVAVRGAARHIGGHRSVFLRGRSSTFGKLFFLQSHLTDGAEEPIIWFLAGSRSAVGFR